jgi:chromosome segregation ATPase
MEPVIRDERAIRSGSERQVVDVHRRDAASAGELGQDRVVQAYWQGRVKAAMDDVSRTQLFADSLQTKINSLRTDFVNRDNRVEREKIQQDLNNSLAELEKLTKEIAEKRKAVAAIEEEARKAGVPPGWLRPGN